MKKLIYVEGSPRKNRSHSINIANGYLDKVKENDDSIEIKKIDLWSMNLPEFTGDMMDAKYAVIGGSTFLLSTSARQLTATEWVE